MSAKNCIMSALCFDCGAVLRAGHSQQNARSERVSRFSVSRGPKQSPKSGLGRLRRPSTSCPATDSITQSNNAFQAMHFVTARHEDSGLYIQGQPSFLSVCSILITNARWKEVMLRNPAVSIPTFSIACPSTRRVTRAGGWLTQNVECGPTDRR